MAKTLLNMTLETCAISFEEVFLENFSLKKNIALPPLLFEMIINKSLERGCLISRKMLKICLSFRDELYWQNIDLSFMGEFNDSFGDLGDVDFSNICKSKISVKKLTFSTKEMTETMVMYLGKLSSTLEHLHIEASNLGVYFNERASKDEHLEAINQIYKNRIKFPKLKYLSINFFGIPMKILDMIDLNSFSNSINILKIKGFNRNTESISNEKLSHYSLMIINSITNYVNLKTLSLFYSTFGEMNILNNSLLTLQQLEILDFTWFGDFDSTYKLDLSALIPCLPNLKHLELYEIFQPITTEIFDIGNKRFKYLGVSNIHDPSIFSLEANEKGSDLNLDGLISVLVNNNNDNYIMWYVMVRIQHKISSITADDLTNSQCDMLRLGILKSISSYPYNQNLFDEVWKVVSHSTLIARWSKDFLERIDRHKRSIDSTKIKTLLN